VIASHDGFNFREIAMKEYQNEKHFGSCLIDRLLTVATVAVILNLSPKTINKLAREGKLACVQVTSRDRRFTHEQVQEYIRSRSTSVRVDKKEPRPVSSAPKKGGDRAPSVGVNGKDLREEMRRWR
jgi:excisionase family DNA binding protein